MLYCLHYNRVHGGRGVSVGLWVDGIVDGGVGGMTLTSAHLPSGSLERNERVLAKGQVLFFYFLP